MKKNINSSSMKKIVEKANVYFDSAVILLNHSPG